MLGLRRFLNRRKTMDCDVKRKFDTYPENIRMQLFSIRKLIFMVAQQNNISDLCETLKWGQPSYVCHSGSTVRLGWNEKHPEQYAIYFHCQTSLIETFKEVYSDTFIYQGNRALIFHLEDVIPIKALSHCLSMSLRYKKIKHLRLLGA